VVYAPNEGQSEVGSWWQELKSRKNASKALQSQLFVLVCMLPHTINKSCDLLKMVLHLIQTDSTNWLTLQCSLDMQIAHMKIVVNFDSKTAKRQSITYSYLRNIGRGCNFGSVL